MEQSYQIPRSALLWILAAVVAVLLPQTLRMPIWLSLIAAGCVVWRLMIHQGRYSYPGKSLRVALVLFTVLVSASQLSSLGIGLDSAASLLALGFVFKLIEMRQKRDIYVVIVLCFVMAMVSFLYSQSVVATVYMALCITLSVGSLVALNRSLEQAGQSTTLWLTLKIVAQAVPLMVVLFLTFPRIAPLWAVPVQSGSAQTGVSDEMSPGTISQLGQSGDLAFRVTFEESEAPAHARMYWRGLVLDEFDNETWRRSRSQRNYTLQAAFTDMRWSWAEAAIAQGEALRYNVILEPTQQPWLYGLHLSGPPNRRTYMNPNFEMFNEDLITQRLNYDLLFYPDYQVDLKLSDRSREQNLRLPESGNSRAREFAQQMRQAAGSDRAYLRSILNYYSSNEFFYTLAPPLLGADRVDEFLFSSRQGFCEHYASSFAFLMRAAGIPARVVVGYQGAEYNRFEDYWMVYQYNAHAWTELWLEGEGWIRVDPTAAVSPERVELGVEAALANDPAFLDEVLFSAARLGGLSWLNSIRLRLDAIEYQWNRRVVNYDEEQQLELLSNLLGDVDEDSMLLLLAAVAIAVIAAVGWSVSRAEPKRRPNPLNVAYNRFAAELAKQGLSRLPGEGPISYQERVSAERPDLSEEVRAFTRLFVHYAYVEANASESIAASDKRSLNAALKQLRAKMRSSG